MNYKFKDCDRKATEGLVQLVACRKEGRNHFFTLNKDNFKKVSIYLERFCQV